MKLKIAAYRANAGETQADLARAIGVSKQAVHLWENGGSLTVPSLVKIAEHYNIGLDDIDLTPFLRPKTEK